MATLADAKRNWVTLNSSRKRELRATRLPVLMERLPVLRAARHATSGCDRTRVRRLRLRVAARFRPRRRLRLDAGHRRSVPSLAASTHTVGTLTGSQYPNGQYPDGQSLTGGQYPRWLQMYTAVGNCLVVFNAAVNFLLMLCFGHKFRRMLNDVLHCRKSSSARPAASTTLAAEHVRSRSVIALRETIF